MKNKSMKRTIYITNKKLTRNLAYLALVCYNYACFTGNFCSCSESSKRMVHEIRAGRASEKAHVTVVNPQVSLHGHHTILK